MSAIIRAPVSIEATIQRAADGEQSAWDTIVRTYWRKVFNIAYRFVGTYDEAEDLTQEIFLKVFRSLGTFDRRANFQTWLISVSRNYCIDRYRSGRRDRAVFAREVDASTVQAEARRRARGGSRRPVTRVTTVIATSSPRRAPPSTFRRYAMTDGRRKNRASLPPRNSTHLARICCAV